MRNRNKPFRDALIRLAGGLGVHVTERTAEADVGALIRSLRPLDSGIELIRVGPQGDGGYLIPDDLDGIEYAFSPGVDRESGFEVELARRGIKVFMADHSVDAPPVAHPALVFCKKHVGCTSDGIYMTLDEWKQAAIREHGGDLLLQMDVEGAEFEGLLNVSDALLAQFRIMVIEFHSLQNLFDRLWFALASRAFARLLRHHSVVHIHPNNCCGSVRSGRLEIPRIAEFTFLRNDRFSRRLPAERFPHPLDRENTRKAPLPLPECWYR